MRALTPHRPSSHTLGGRSSRLTLERLESRDVPSFYDGFERPTLDPFWNRVLQHSGTVAPSPDLPHSGAQSAKLRTINTGANKNLFLIHDFAEPVYGTVSVWVYDNGADVWSSNYLYLNLWNSAAGMRSDVGVMDYDLGPGNGGDVYYYRGWVDANQAPFRSAIDRTQGWHHWEIDAALDRTTVAVDNQVVFSGGPGLPFDQVSIWVGGPSWRPAWTGYFDDFSFQEAAPPDVTVGSDPWVSTTQVQYTDQTSVDPGPLAVGTDSSAVQTFDAGDVPIGDPETVHPSPPGRPATEVLTAGDPDDPLWREPTRPYVLVVAAPTAEESADTRLDLAAVTQADLVLA